MADELEALVGRLIAAGAVTDADCLAVRRLVWDDGQIGQHEADALFAIDDACAQRTNVWADLLIEAVSHFIVHRVPPFGYIDNANAAWLMARIGPEGKQEGRIDSFATLALLVKVLEAAHNAPDALKAYAIAQMENVIRTGGGPTPTGAIDDVEVGLLRRLVFAGGGDGGAYVSKAEAEMLFRLKDLTLDQPNAASWKALFVQAVGNHFMAHPSGHRFDMGKAAEDEHFLADIHPHAVGFLQRMLASVGPGNPLPAWAEMRRMTLGASGAETAHDAAAFDAAVAADRAIGPAKIAELHADALTDGTLDAFEQAPLDFIAQETGGSAAELEARLRGQ